MNLRELVVLGVVVIAMTIAPAQAATVAYWNIPAADDDTLTDLAGGDQTLVGTNDPFNQSAINVAPIPVPNPDPVTTGGDGSIYVNGFSAGREAPHLEGAGASVFQMTGSSSFTFEGWIRAEDGDTGYIASDRHRGNSFRGWFLELQGSGALNFYSNSNGTANTATSGAIDDGVSRHFAAVWDHINGEMRLYIDGGLVDSTSHTVGAYSVFAFSIGGRENSTTDDDFDANMLTAGARLDELRFSDQALAPSEFLNSTIPAPAALSMGLAALAMLGARRRR